MSGEAGQHEPPDAGPAEAPGPARLPRWADATLAAPGAIAIGLAVAAMVPLALTAVGWPWRGLVVLAGAGLFWWALMWVARQADTPSPWTIVPAMLLLAVFLARPLAEGLAFFNTSAVIMHQAEQARWLLALDREAGVIAAQKLVVVLLLAPAVRQAIHLRRWSESWFRMALLAGVAGLLVLGTLQMLMHDGGPGLPGRTEQAMLSRVPPAHMAAGLAAVACWLVGTMLSSGRRWGVERRQHTEDDWAAGLRSPHLMTMLLAGLLLAGVLAGAVACGAGPVAWRQMAPWAGLAAGLMLLLLAPRWWARLLGVLLAAGGLAGVGDLWPGHLLARSFARGDMLGWQGWDVSADDSAGLLWLAQWRGAGGVAVVALAVLMLAAAQVRAFRRAGQADERLARGGALAGSWLLAAGWLIGPGQVTGAAALLALTLWAMSLGPVSPKPRGGLSGFLVGLAVVVVFCYGLVGLTSMAHEPMWLSFHAAGGGDKKLHGIWGLYVTLACCLALAPLGRWPAVLLGTTLSVALAVAAEYVQKWWLVKRSFDLADAGAYALAAALVAAGLLMVPYTWSWWRSERGRQAVPAK